jgi:hypothetical protein
VEGSNSLEMCRRNKVHTNACKHFENVRSMVQSDNLELSGLTTWIWPHVPFEGQVMSRLKSS